MKTDMYITAFKYLGTVLYSFCATSIVVARNDSYEAVFTDPFFWASAFIGTSLMLLLEKADPKTRKKIGIRRILFSIMACIAIIFVAGTIRASMIEDEEFERNHWFYGIVIFLCAIAPEFVRNLLEDTGKQIGEAAKRGLVKRVEKVTSGEDSPAEEYNLNTPDDEQ